MGQDRGLGQARGAGRIDETGGVLRPHRLPAAGEQPRAAASELVTAAQRLFPRKDPTFALRRVTLDQDDPLQARQVRAQGNHLVEQFPVLDDEHLRLGVVQEVLDLLRRIGLVNSDGHQAGVRNADIGDLPLRPVRGPERHPILWIQPLGEQGVGDPAYRPVVVDPADRRPAFPRFEVKGGRVTPALRGSLEQRRHGFGQLAGHLRGRRRTYSRAHAATIRELRQLPIGLW